MHRIASTAMRYVQAVSDSILCLYYSSLSSLLSGSILQVTKTAMSKSNIDDNEISAGLMTRTPWGTWGEAKDVAKGALFLASSEASWVTGVALPVDGGYLAA